MVFVVTLGLGADAAVGARWVRSWFAPGQPFLAYPSAANLRWLAEAGFAAAGAARSRRDRRGPGAPDRGRVRAVRPAGALRGAAAAGAGGGRVEEVFLFPAHDLAGGYEMPEAEVEAFERVIRPRLG